MPTKHTILDRIKKAVLLAESSNEGEARNAVKYIQKMSQRYNINVDELTFYPKLQKDEAEGKQKFDRYVSVPQRVIWRNLMAGCAKYMGCSGAVLKGQSKMQILGYQDDIDVAVYLYEIAKREIEAETAKYMSLYLGTDKIKERNRHMFWMMEGFVAFLEDSEKQFDHLHKARYSNFAIQKLNHSAFIYQLEVRHGFREGRSYHGYAHDENAYQKGQRIRIQKPISTRRGT